MLIAAAGSQENTAPTQQKGLPPGLLSFSCSLEEPYVTAELRTDKKYKKYKKNQMYTNDLSLQPLTGRRLCLFKTSIAELVPRPRSAGQPRFDVWLVNRCPVGGILYKVLELQPDIFLVYAYGNPPIVVSGDRVLYKWTDQFACGSIENQLSLEEGHIYFSGYQSAAVAPNPSSTGFFKQVSLEHLLLAIKTDSDVVVPVGRTLNFRSVNCFAVCSGIAWVLSMSGRLYRINCADFTEEAESGLPNMDGQLVWNSVAAHPSGLICATQISYEVVTEGSRALLAWFSNGRYPQLQSKVVLKKRSNLIGLRFLEHQGLLYVLAGWNEQIVDLLLVKNNVLQQVERLQIPVQKGLDYHSIILSMLIEPDGPGGFNIFFGIHGIKLVYLRLRND